MDTACTSADIVITKREVVLVGVLTSTCSVVVIYKILKLDERATEDV